MEQVKLDLLNLVGDLIVSLHWFNIPAHFDSPLLCHLPSLTGAQRGVLQTLSSHSGIPSLVAPLTTASFMPFFKTITSVNVNLKDSYKDFELTLCILNGKTVRVTGPLIRIDGGDEIPVKTGLSFNIAFEPSLSGASFAWVKSTTREGSVTLKGRMLRKAGELSVTVTRHASSSSTTSNNDEEQEITLSIDLENSGSMTEITIPVNVIETATTQ
ncbi:hypothetical protein BLNAU_19159 [Blattamonas nauphoetae]|uniref:Uncharacterized protein n=1 Tax=Blattamonas nauphoetae TaxID=2049346 RepID=A0ABQ9X4T7_9EUKA|nr:hypothetical protein BLNAU_19159 [Blattamonas nauphoetae]